MVTERFPLLLTVRVGEEWVSLLPEGIYAEKLQGLVGALEKGWDRTMIHFYMNCYPIPLRLCSSERRSSRGFDASVPLLCGVTVLFGAKHTLREHGGAKQAH